MAQTGAYKLSDIDAPQHSEVHTGTVSGVKTKAEPAPAQYQGVANPPDEGQVSTGPYNLSDIDGAVNSAPPQDEEKFSTKLLKDIPYALPQVGIGALKGAGNTANNIGHLLYPDALAKHLTGAPSAEKQDAYFAPSNPTQGTGKMMEQAAEFMVPGGAEEEGAIKLADLAPQLGKFAKPLARVLTSGASGAAVNAAQGGSPVTGAEMGAGGRVIGEAGKALAPTLTGIAQGLKPPFGRTGAAILDETSGIMPHQIRNSARGILDVLNPELDRLAKAASVKPNPVRALLPAPPQEIPLAGAENFIRDTPGELLPAAPFPRENIVGGSSPRVASELGSTEATIPPRMTRDDLFMHSGVRPPTELPTSGPGVLIRPFEGQSGGIPPTIPNASVSLGPARQIASDLTDRAFGQNEPKMYKGVKRMANMVNNDLEGNPLPENVTPYQALEMKRGVGKAQPKGSWNPESSNAFKGPRTSLYKALDKGFTDAVPEAGPLNKRISSLIPATEPPQNVFWGHALGPAVGALYGGLRGARTGGFGGAAAGAAEGGLLGLAIPTAMNAGARTMWSPAAQRFIVPALVGAGAQATRKPEEK